MISVLKQVGATHYICGPSASSYMEPEKFDEAGITFEYMQYDYPEYPQMYPPYDPYVSILDLMFMTE
ncbi:MAG: WbqC family protein [Anaerolineales bacterium]